MALKVFGGLVAHQLEGVAAFDQGLALGGQALQLDGFHLAAVLFALAAALRLLVVVEFALDPVGGAVEDVDRRPEEIVEVGFEAGVVQGGDQGVEDVGDGAGDMVALRQRSGIGLVRRRDGSHRAGVRRGHGRSGMRCGAVRSRRARSSGCSVGSTATLAAFMATKAGGRAGPAPAAQRRAGAQRRMAKAGYFVSRWKGGPRPPPENSRPQPLPVRAVCWPIALSKAGARSSPTLRMHPSDADDGAPAACILRAGYAASAMKRATSWGAICTRTAARRHPVPSRRRSSLKSPSARRQHDRLDPGRVRPVDQAVAIAPSPAGSLSRAM